MNPLLVKSLETLTSFWHMLSPPRLSAAELLASSHESERIIGVRLLGTSLSEENLQRLLEISQDDPSPRVQDSAEKTILKAARRSPYLAELLAKTILDSALREGSNERSDIELMIRSCNRIGACLQNVSASQNQIDALVSPLLAYFRQREQLAEELVESREDHLASTSAYIAPPINEYADNFGESPPPSSTPLNLDCIFKGVHFNKMMDAYEVLREQKMLFVRALVGMPGALAEEQKCIAACELEPTPDGWKTLEFLAEDLAVSPHLRRALENLYLRWMQQLEIGNLDYSYDDILELRKYITR